jgi:hypothetical protein
MYFELNRGQADPRISFIIHGPGYTALLAPEQLSFASRSGVVQVDFVGANRHAHARGRHRLPGVVNYLIGRDRRCWLRDIPTYAEVEYHDVYPGIDLLYRARGSLEYAWIVHPGARPSAIRFRLSGGGGARLSSSGMLRVPDRTGELDQATPLAYQYGARGRTVIPAVYHRLGPSTFTLRIGGFDGSEPLIIDPVVTFATYLGGQSGDSGKSIAIDRAGNAYVTGLTVSSDFPTKHALETFHSPPGGPSDVFLTELSSRGSLVFSTFLGGSSFDEGFGVAVDASGIYLSGATESPDFPVVKAFQPTLAGGTDGFVARLSPRGDALLYSSYIGGPQNDFAYALALDASGNAYVTGDTVPPSRGGGANAPPSLPHAFAAKIAPDGSLTYKLSLAGAFAEAGYGIAADRTGDAYVVGLTQSQDFPSPVSPSPGLIGPIDAFIVKIDPTGNKILYSTHLGGDDISVADAVTVDADGSAYVTGQTAAKNFPVVGGFQAAYGGNGPSLFPGDAFVVKLDAFGRIRYSTYLGGALDDEGVAIAVDGSRNIYVTGWTESANFPVRDAVQPSFRGATCGFTGHPSYPCSDAFVSQVRSDGRLGWSTFLGGSGADYGNGIAVTPSGSVYVAGTTGSPDLATVHGFQPQSLDRSSTPLDAFVVRLSPGTTPRHSHRRPLASSGHVGSSLIPLDQTSGFAVTFYSKNPGQGYVFFGPSCSALVEIATRDFGAGTTAHTVLVQGNDMPGTVGDIGLSPSVDYRYETVTSTHAGVEIDNNNRNCYVQTISSKH